MTAARATSDLEHLSCFHCLQLTVEHAQNLRFARPVASLICRANLLASDDSVTHSFCTPPVNAQPSQFESRMLLPYRAQRRLQLTLCEADSMMEVGSYTLDLSPFSESKKSLAAKMKLKNARQEDVGFLHVRVKMSSQEIAQPTLVDYAPVKAHQAEIPQAQWARAVEGAKSLHVFVLSHSKYRGALSGAFIYYKCHYARVVIACNSKSPENPSINALFSYPFFQDQNHIKIEVWQEETNIVDRMLGFNQLNLPNDLASRGDPLKSHQFVLPMKNLQNEVVGEIQCYVGLSSTRCLSAMCEMNASIDDLVVPPVVRAVPSTPLPGSPSPSPAVSPPKNTQPLPSHMPTPNPGIYDNEISPKWLGRAAYASIEAETPVFQIKSLAISVYCLDGVKIPYSLSIYVGTHCLVQTFNSLASSYLFHLPYNNQRYVVFEVRDERGTEIARRAYDLTDFLSVRGNILDGTAKLFTMDDEGAKVYGQVQLRFEKKTNAIPAPICSSLF